MDRIAQLKKFIAEEPADPFNRYALALEYLKSDATQALKIFGELAEQHPNYLPTYYPYAHQLIEQSNPEKAEEIFKKGIAMAKAAHDLKTLKELQGAYHDWKSEQ